MNFLSCCMALIAAVNAGLYAASGKPFNLGMAVAYSLFTVIHVVGVARDAR